jgi:hypothetical protein
MPRRPATGSELQLMFFHSMSSSWTTGNFPAACAQFLHRKRWPSTRDNSFGIPIYPHTPILVRGDFSRLRYGSLALQPAALLALLSERTGLTPSPRGLLLPGFRRLGHPHRRRISLRCQLSNLHRQDLHLLDHQPASLHYLSVPSRPPRRRVAPRRQMTLRRTARRFRNSFRP